jgi:hypothetical protein
VTQVQSVVKNVVDKLNFDKPVEPDKTLANAKAQAQEEARRQVASLEAQMGGDPAPAPEAKPQEVEEPYKPSQIITYENKIFKIDSVPQGAEVYVDGRYVARTPTQFIVPERHHVRVALTLKGYEDHEEDLVPYKYNHEMKIVLEKRAPSSAR